MLSSFLTQQFYFHSQVVYIFIILNDLIYRDEEQINCQPVED